VGGASSVFGRGFILCTSSFAPGLPERTDSEPSEHYTECSRHGHVGGGASVGVIGNVLTRQRHQAYSGKCKKKKARRLQPKLVRNSAKMPQSGSNPI